MGKESGLNVKKKGGIHLEAGETFVADSRNAGGDINIVSHAHADHAFEDDCPVITSEITASLLRERFGSQVEQQEHDRVELIPSGHIIGSSAALVDEKILYTGDVSLQERLYMDGFQPVEAEELVIEATYGIPAYRLPEQREVVKKIRDWLQDNEEPLALFGYSLGKAQKIQRIVQQSVDRPVVAHGAVKNMNDAVEAVTDLEFDARPYGDNEEVLEENGIVVAPSRLSNSDFADRLERKYGVKKAGFSGWAVHDSFRHRGDYDATFALSDHCGFDDLVKLVREVDPEKVYTHHGFDEEFAQYLKRELGINARALKSNQSSLNDF
ncbi:MAG: MBL fold metallo-hydrolase RNA specificity domain-containing protein [Candidatus Nanohaloarchaea archaeon]